MAHRASLQTTATLTFAGRAGVSFNGQGGRLTYLGGTRPDSFSASSSTGVTAYGRGGHDVLLGERFADFLDVGPGRDDLVGGRRDRCVQGEKVRRCGYVAAPSRPR